MSQNTEYLEKRAWPESCFSDWFLSTQIFFDQWTLTDVNNITNLVDPADCTDFRPGTWLNMYKQLLLSTMAADENYQANNAFDIFYPVAS